MKVRAASLAMCPAEPQAKRHHVLWVEPLKGLLQSLRSAASIGAAGCAVAWQVDTHAATRIEAEDRASLERLCRYVTGPPLAACRLQFIDVDHLTFRLKTPWSDGTTHLVLSPLELIEKLAALSYDHANEERYGAAIEALDAAGKTGSAEAFAAAKWKQT